jgi:hypothetical protein
LRIIHIPNGKWIGRKEAKLQLALFGVEAVTARKHEPIWGINDMNGGCTVCGI